MADIPSIAGRNRVVSVRIRPPLAVSPAHPDVSAGSHVTIRVRSAPAPADRSQSLIHPRRARARGPTKSPPTKSRPIPDARTHVRVFVRNGNQVATRTGMSSKHPSCVRTCARTAHQPPAVAWRGWLAAGRESAPVPAFPQTSLVASASSVVSRSGGLGRQRHAPSRWR